MPDTRANIAFQLGLVRCEIVNNGESSYVSASFSDAPNDNTDYMTNGDDFFREDAYREMVKRLLVLDWLQEQVLGKTATFDCANPTDIWVKAEVTNG